jgi:hypothetical protein
MSKIYVVKSPYSTPKTFNSEFAALANLRQMEVGRLYEYTLVNGQLTSPVMIADRGIVDWETKRWRQQQQIKKTLMDFYNSDSLPTAYRPPQLPNFFKHQNLYTPLDEAAVESLNAYAGVARQANREYGGVLYPLGGVYRSTELLPGTTGMSFTDGSFYGGWLPSLHIQVPDLAYKANEMSLTDYATHERIRQPSFTKLGNGAIVKYTPPAFQPYVGERLVDVSFDYADEPFLLFDDNYIDYLKSAGTIEELQSPDRPSVVTDPLWRQDSGILTGTY